MYADRGLGAVRAPLGGADAQTRALRVAQAPWSDSAAIRRLAGELGPVPFSLIALFVSPFADFDTVVRDAQDAFPGTDVMACTTAGEIGAAGYEEGQIIAVGFPQAHFASRSLLIRSISKLDGQRAMDEIALARLELNHDYPGLPHGFAFMVVDGLSLSEDTFSAALAPALGGLPVFGGSAGDGTDFKRTRVALNGQVAEDAAVVSVIRSSRRVKVFSLNHLIPTDHQMVVTEADPARRIVKSINAEPAAREYARIVGKDPEQLDRFTFAAHPVVVRIGEDHHVRAIQQINENGEMVFFSAVDEGMVLTVAKADNMERHLDQTLAQLDDGISAPSEIIGCDCILRRIEAEQTQQTRGLSAILQRHNVTGFSTYGEQIGPLHVNHTMSGVAFYPPAPDQSQHAHGDT